MNIILLGAPGSGKGTQSQNLSALYNLNHLSTGDLLRAEITANTPLGQQAKTIMDSGNLVSDDIVIAMIANRLNQQGTLFDGFPRTLNQAQALDTLLATHNNSQIDYVIELDVDQEEIIQRMLARGRADDNEHTIRNRLNVYNQQTKPLIDYYQQQNKHHKIDGSGAIEDITARIQTIIEPTS